MIKDEDDKQQPGSVNDWQILWIKAVANAWKDPEFKNQLMADPRAALETRFGTTLPEGVKLKVEQLGKADHQVTGLPGTQVDPPMNQVQPDGTVVLPLPAPPDNTGDQALALASLMEWYQHDGCCGNPCCS